jgi:hypothetical protein
MIGDEGEKNRATTTTTKTTTTTRETLRISLCASLIISRQTEDDIEQEEEKIISTLSSINARPSGYDEVRLFFRYSAVLSLSLSVFLNG